MLRKTWLACVVMWTCAVEVINQVRTRAAVEANIVTRRRDAVVNVVLTEISRVTLLAGTTAQNL